MSIVVGVDGSVESENAVRWAAHEAALRGDGLVLVHVRVATIPYIPFSGELPEVPDDADNFGSRALTRASGIVTKEAPGVPVSTRSVWGHPTAELLDAAASASLLIVGRRGLGAIGSMFLGSVSTRVAAHASCPVIVVPAGSDVTAGGHVVVGVAPGAPDAGRVLRFALDEAARRGTRLVVIAAYSIPFIDSLTRDPMAFGSYDRELHAATATALASLVAQTRDVSHALIDVETFVVSENTSHAIVHSSEDAALTVVGSRGHSMVVGAVLGSVSQHVIRHLDTPIAVVHTQSD